MKTLLDLYLVFFKIGVCSFGGLSMIPVINEEMVRHGWMTLEEVADIRTAVSEAVTNAIIHGYPDGVHTVVIRAILSEETLELWVTDEGVGMEDVKQAMEPLYTSRPELERSGMGFMFMEAFMDQVEVQSAPGVGTTVYMKKKIGRGAAEQEG